MDISFYFCEKPASLRQREVEIKYPPPTEFYSRDSPPNIKKYGCTPTTNRKKKKKKYVLLRYTYSDYPFGIFKHFL
jgi:hypothetical protein